MRIEYDFQNLTWTKGESGAAGEDKENRSRRWFGVMMSQESSGSEENFQELGDNR